MNGRKWLIANVNRIQHELRKGITKRAEAVLALMGYGYTKQEADNIARRKTLYR